jgi:hypothetical protein
MHASVEPEMEITQRSAAVDGSAAAGSASQKRIEPDNPAARKDFYLSLRDLRIHAEFSGDGGKVLLHHLERDDGRVSPMMFRDEGDCPRLLPGRRRIVCINQDIGVEKSQSLHRRS